MNLLLDTCTLLWLTDDDCLLSETVRARLDDSEAIVRVSALSAWELGIKTAKGKLILPSPVSDWFPRVVKEFDLHEAPVTGAIAARSTELPPIHGDPFDRLLIATAMEHGFTLLTSDRIIPQYPGVKTLW